jgi:hypothetical protein
MDRGCLFIPPKLEIHDIICYRSVSSSAVYDGKFLTVIYHQDSLELQRIISHSVSWNRSLRLHFHEEQTSA